MNTKNNNTTRPDICILGGGLTGLTAALAVAKTGQNVVLCAKRPEIRDQRTTALLNGTVEFLEKLGIWDAMRENAFPLKTMRLVDGTGRLIRIPQTDFHASEIELDAFGYNVKNSNFIEVLAAEVDSHPDITWLDSLATVSIENGHIEVQATDSNHIILPNFVVGADGRNSSVRETFGLGVRKWEYPQSAIVLDFKHQFPTNFASTEFHTEDGPFTVVPQNHKQAGLVWMDKPARVEETMALEKEDLQLLLEQKMQSYLGKVEIIDIPVSFPIGGLIAKRFGSKNCALIGEAAHAFPPIGAQGFNLGVRDIEALTDVLVRYSNSENIGENYHQRRFTDVHSRTMGVDVLNRSLLSDFLPVQLARSIGLHALANIAPLRKTAMRMGISPNK